MNAWKIFAFVLRKIMGHFLPSWNSTVQSGFDIPHVVLWKHGQCSNVPAQILILWRAGVHLFAENTSNTFFFLATAQLSMTLGRITGREKHKKSWKEKCTMSQERDSNYFYRILLSSLGKCEGFKNAHFNRNKFRENWKSLTARLKCSSYLTA